MWTSKITLWEDVASSNLGKLVTESAQVTRCGFTFGIFWRTEFIEFSLQCIKNNPLTFRISGSVRLMIQPSAEIAGDIACYLTMLFANILFIILRYT